LLPERGSCLGAVISDETLMGSAASTRGRTIKNEMSFLLNNFTSFP
jgi:hypothetical protein